MTKQFPRSTREARRAVKDGIDWIFRNKIALDARLVRRIRQANRRKIVMARQHPHLVMLHIKTMEELHLPHIKY